MGYLSKKKKVLLLLSAIGIVLSISMFSYAWFVAQVRGDNPSNNVVTSGVMEITYSEGQVVGTTTNMLPGQSITKSFTVRNTGNVATIYDIYLNDVVNTFTDKNDLVYSLTSVGGGATINQSVAPSSNTKIASNVTLAVNATHTYTLTLSFLETNNDQSDNMGVSFSAKVGLIEKEKVIDTVYYQGIDSSTNDYWVEENVTLINLDNLSANFVINKEDLRTGAYNKYTLNSEKVVIDASSCIHNPMHSSQDICISRKNVSEAQQIIKDYYKWDDATQTSEFANVSCYTYNDGSVRCIEYDSGYTYQEEMSAGEGSVHTSLRMNNAEYTEPCYSWNSGSACYTFG